MCFPSFIYTSIFLNVLKRHLNVFSLSNWQRQSTRDTSPALLSSWKYTWGSDDSFKESCELLPLCTRFPAWLFTLMVQRTGVERVVSQPLTWKFPQQEHNLCDLVWVSPGFKSWTLQPNVTGEWQNSIQEQQETGVRLRGRADKHTAHSQLCHKRPRLEQKRINWS